MLRTAAQLGGLSIASQALALLALPVIALYYGPEDFNTLAAFTSAATIAGIVSCLRLELALLIVEADEDAAALVWLSLILCVVTSGVVLATTASLIPSSSLDARINAAFVLLPVAALLSGIQSVLTHYAVRRKRLVATGVARLIQTAAGIAVQLAIGISAIMHLGLVWGFLANLFIGGLVLLLLSGLSLADLGPPRPSAMRRALCAQWDYVRYSTFDALLNTSGTQLPLFLISTLAGGVAGGFLFMAMKLFYTPSTIISGAFAKIYHANVGEAHRSGDLTKRTLETLEHLFRFGITFVILAEFLGPWLVSLLMGQEWQQTGELIRWIAPWIALQLVASPISSVMFPTESQKHLLWLTLGGFVVRFGAVLMATMYRPTVAAHALAVANSAFYLVCFVTFARKANIGALDVAGVAGRSAALWAAAIGFSLIILGAAQAYAAGAR